VSEVKASICVISDSNKLHEIEGTWNQLIGRCSKNPFLLSGFIKQFMEFNRLKRWVPLVLVISVDNKIVGISPLKIKRKFGVRFAKFLLNPWFSPDFIGDDQYREICLAYTLDFLFKTLRCQFVDLTLPANSHNLRIIKQKCKTSKIYFYIKQETGRRILPVQCTWAEFETLKGRNFRRKFKRIERNLDRLGPWRITCAENGKQEFDVIKKILEIDKMSWKEELRTQRGIKIDSDLMMIWNGAQYMAQNEPDFKWSVWFLELNDQKLAHILIFQYQNVAYFAKTSYDERYKKFAPGLYVQNAAIRDLFNKSQVRRIDFLTALPYHETWTSLCLPRVRIIMSHKSVLPTMIKFALLSKPVKGILTLLSKRSPSIPDLIGL
jgi:hypothetical protein